MPKVIILKGLPASGKSRWAKEILKDNFDAYKRVNKDLLREMLDNSQFSGKAELFVLKMRDKIILAALEAGKHVIVDDANLNPKHETHIRELVKDKATVQVKFFDADVEECITRDLQRPKSVGKDVILYMYDKWLKPAPPVIEFKRELPVSIICDIDGTIADKGKRNPYAWMEVGGDKPITETIKLLKILKIQKPFLIITIISGRDEICRDLTEAWLKEYDIPYDELYMRQKDSREKDAIIKKQIYDKYIKDKYNVWFVLDDRNQTVDMWRKIGLAVFQVDYGNF